jgi:hypothetical protein
MSGTPQKVCLDYRSLRLFGPIRSMPPELPIQRMLPELPMERMLPELPIERMLPLLPTERRLAALANDPRHPMLATEYAQSTLIRLLFDSCMREATTHSRAEKHSLSCHGVLVLWLAVRV